MAHILPNELGSRFMNARRRNKRIRSQTAGIIRGLGGVTFILWRVEEWNFDRSHFQRFV
jgi:hypothetical protein